MPNIHVCTHQKYEETEVGDSLSFSMEQTTQRTVVSNTICFIVCMLILSVGKEFPRGMVGETMSLLHDYWVPT